MRGYCEFAAHSKKGESASGMGKWLHLLKNINNMERQDTHGESEIFQKLFSVCELAQLDDEEKEKYHKSVLEYEDVQDAMRCSNRRGLAEGLAEDMEKGMEKGLKKGKAEIARAMLDDHVEISVIVKFTGMTEEEILELY